MQESIFDRKKKLFVIRRKSVISNVFSVLLENRFIDGLSHILVPFRFQKALFRKELMHWMMHFLLPVGEFICGAILGKNIGMHVVVALLWCFHFLAYLLSTSLAQLVACITNPISSRCFSLLWYENKLI
jgi:hypothetical protein